MKKTILGLLTFLFFFNPHVAYAAPPGNPTDWIMTFSDEFNGNTLDHTKWGVTARLGARNIPTRDLHWYLNNEAHVVSNGTLKIIAKHQSVPDTDEESITPDYDPVKFPYTSGMIGSKVDANSPYLVNFSSTYGYFEARIKVPPNPGTWPTFWLLPAPGGWPPEIDIMEIHTSRLQNNNMTSHVNCNYPLSVPVCWSYQIGAPTFVLSANEGNFSTAFHTFAVNWEPDLIVWYIDGVERFRTTEKVPIVDPNGMTGMFVKVTLDIAINDVPDPINFPQQMEIDYIRVYQKKSFDCNRCSTVHGCERAQFQSWTSSCAQPIPGSIVIRTTDCSCPQISGGDNNRCTPACLPTPTPLPGDLNGDTLVNRQDYDILVSNFGNTTCGNVADIDGSCKVDMFDYNLLVGNFGK